MKFNKVLTAFVLLCFLAACQTNPFTGKKTWALVPNSQLFPMAFSQYDEILKESKVITGTKDANKVKEIGSKIAKSAEKYLESEGQGNFLKDYEWDYKLIDSKEVNAWCLPGGKIAVYTGILPVSKTDAGLAVIMGHEVSHALLNHGQRKLSQNQLTVFAAMAGGAAFRDESDRNLFYQAFGLGSQFGVALPYSRKYETEADDLGLKLMAIAGYDPEAGVGLWQRMSDLSGGSKGMEFLSTHPSNESRIKNISKQVESARELGRKFGVTTFKK